MRLTWREGRYTSVHGYVGALESPVFTVSYSTESRGADRNAPWVLRSELPGLAHRSWKAPSQEAARNAAELHLADWLRAVTEPPSNDREAVG